MFSLDVVTTRETQVSEQLAQLAQFAAREDWLYQSAQELAAEFARIANAFCTTHPGAEEICSHYIGLDRNNELVFRARIQLHQAFKSIACTLNRLQGKASPGPYLGGGADLFTAANPAQTFLYAEVAKRQLQSNEDGKAAVRAQQPSLPDTSKDALTERR